MVDLAEKVKAYIPKIYKQTSSDYQASREAHSYETILKTPIFHQKCLRELVQNFMPPIHMFIQNLLQILTLYLFNRQKIWTISKLES